MHRRHEMPFGAEVTPDGVRFALWAPTARKVALVLDGSERPLPDAGDGWRRIEVAGARAGARYGYRIDGDLIVPDPASRAQPDDVHGRSLVVDPRAYAWFDSAWAGRPWEEAVIHEVHLGTASPEGTFAGLAARLPQLAELGVTAVELLPIAEFPGRRNWGYDGVLPYAPDAAYGSPDDLKRLVDRAHALGLMMMLDVVHNHFGPSGNYLHAYAKTFFTERHPTPWGAGINFDGEGSRVVRDFFLHNALYWLEEYHLDGLRFDAVHAILDDGEPHFLEELGRRIRDSFPDRQVHLVLENEANQARWLGRQAEGRPILHTAQWADDLHHCWHSLLTGESEGYYEDFAEEPSALLARCLAEGFAFQGEPFRHKGGEPRGEPSAHLPPTAFVTFLQNHDQIGNRARGERLAHLADAGQLALARAMLLLAPQIPMLFQGEEWSASAPFQFFVDFDAEPDLAEAVRQGRRREFSHFKEFSSPELAEAIPDPTVLSTFEASRIDWVEAGRAPHAAVLADTRTLLALRRTIVVPLLKSGWIGAHRETGRERLVDVTWTFREGTLRAVCNFDEAPATIALGPAEVVWTSPKTEAASGSIRLPVWSGVVLKGSSDGR